MFYPPSVHWSLLVVILLSNNVYAGFDAATEAYLLGNYEKARYEALISAMDGRAEAQMLMGQLYLKGEGVEKDVSLAIYWYEKAAEQGFTPAQFIIGSMYYEGKVTAKDYQKAWRWLSAAHQSGNLKTQVMLDNLLPLENGDVVNITDSLTILEAAASRGEIKAQLLLAKKQLLGIDVKQDKAKAVQAVTDLAQQGYIKAQKYLGEMYAIGDGVTQDYIEAYAWSMAYSGSKELGGLIREGKQTARSALRKLDESQQNAAYLKSKEYFELYVLPSHPNARPVGPNDYRVIVHRAANKNPNTKPVADSAVVGTVAVDGNKSPSQRVPKNARPGHIDTSGSVNKVRSATTTDLLNEPKVVLSTDKAISDASVLSQNSGAQPKPDVPVKTDETLISTTVSSTKVSSIAVSRDVAAVNLTLEKHKGQVDGYFNLAQEEDKSLHGRIDFEVRIAPSGDVSDVHIIANELDSPTLEQQLIDHLKSVKFPKEPVAPYTFIYPLTLLPR